MAWLYKRKNSKYWWIGYRAHGKQSLRSTEKTSRKEAEEVLAQFNLMNQAKQAGALTRKFYLDLVGATAKSITLVDAMEEWMESARIGEGTRPKYQHEMNTFARFLNATDKGPSIEEVDAPVIRKYLRHRKAKTSTANANSVRKILSAFFGWHFKQDNIASNPVAKVDTLKPDESEKQKPGRRAFTLEEVKTAYRVAPNDFWRFMVIAGFYTGLRLGDVVSLKWESVDFADGMIRVKTSKRSKTAQIPIQATFRKVLMDLASKTGAKNPSGFIWPEKAAQYAAKKVSGVLSHEFRRVVLEPAGLVVTRSDGDKSKGKEAALSYHCFRHTFITLLKLAGGSQAVAKELATHSSDLISDLYTHIPVDALRGPIDRLPEVEI